MAALVHLPQTVADEAVVDWSVDAIVEPMELAMRTDLSGKVGPHRQGGCQDHHLAIETRYRLPSSPSRSRT